MNFIIFVTCLVVSLWVVDYLMFRFGPIKINFIDIGDRISIVKHFITLLYPSIIVLVSFGQGLFNIMSIYFVILTILQFIFLFAYVVFAISVMKVTEDATGCCGT